MYVFDLWFADRRAAIARAEVAAAWAEARAEAKAEHPGHDRLIDQRMDAAFEKAVRVTTHNIHPLVILGLRRRITE